MTKKAYDPNDFYGKQNNSVMCPVPDCGHIGSFISKIHCRMHHGMEREEVYKKYGIPKSMGRGWLFAPRKNEGSDFDG